MDLTQCQITEEGLKAVMGLTQIQRVSVCRSKLPRGGYEELQKALPNCEIN